MPRSTKDIVAIRKCQQSYIEKSEEEEANNQDGVTHAAKESSAVGTHAEKKPPKRRRTSLIDSEDKELVPGAGDNDVGSDESGSILTKS